MFHLTSDLLIIQISIWRRFSRLGRPVLEERLELCFALRFSGSRVLVFYHLSSLHHNSKI